MHLKNEIMRIALVSVGITSIASLVYLGGPFIAIGGWHPLQSYLVREILIVVLIAAAASAGSFHFYRRRKKAKALAQGVSEAVKPESDEAVLKDKMKDALATLKSASGGKKDFLYDLPWYVLIGPPGSGKTTALVNSGLKFPLSRGASPAAIAGVGGTRYCDWWFTEEAVLIDTAGRYTTQDSDAKADKQSWFAFLDLLKKNRKRQPINGVIVAISLEDLMMLSSAELAAHSAAIRARLLELHERLQDEPVPNTRVVLFGFPAQMARLKQQIFDFLNQIFEPTRYHANATLRGFYFTSGTQQGSPIDQLIGSLA